MPFAELEHTSLTDYVEKHRVRSSTWAFLHLAKTAGTSLKHSLEAMAPPCYPLYLENYDLGREEIDRSKFERVARFAAMQNALPTNEKYSVCFGHIRYRHLRLLQREIPGLRTFTFLRDPVDRVVSEYRYRSTPAYWMHETFLDQFPNIGDFAASPGIVNVMTQSLMEVGGEIDADEKVRLILNHYDFIGLSEAYSSSASALFGMMDIVHRPVERLNETIATDRNNIEIRAKDIDLINAINALDARLYRRAREILTPHLPVWDAHFDGLLSLPARPAANSRADAVSGPSVDLVGPLIGEGWSVQDGNQWIVTQTPGLRLHPNHGDRPPPRLRLADALRPGRYRFDADVLVFDNRCCAHRLVMSLSGAASPNSWSVSLSGARKGRVQWTQAIVDVSEPSDVQLELVVDDAATRADYSATRLVSASFTRL